MKKRIISAVIALAIIIPFIWVGKIPFAVAIGIIGVLAYKEATDLGNYPNLIKGLGLIALEYLILGNYGLFVLDNAISYSRLLVPIILILLPCVFYEEKYDTKNAITLLGYVFYLGFTFNLLIIYRNINFMLFIYLLLLPLLTDLFAYLIGSLIGKHKMCPKISPKKSWEGALGGLIGGSAIGIIFYSNLVGEFSLKVSLITMLLSIVAQLGDLYFSKVKRNHDIKDFSNLMPGHGGILDRLDSISFVIMAYAVLITLL